jgi:predicted HTH domain antitoxin
MEELTIKYPKDLELTVNLTKAEMELHLRLMAALKMYELGKNFAGKAGELAGLSPPQFFESCGIYGVSIFNYSSEEIEDELQQDLVNLRSFIK